MNNLTKVDDLQEKRMSGKESWLLKKAVRPEGGGDTKRVSTLSPVAVGHMTFIWNGGT